MLDAANGNQIAWLLPFGLLGGVVALWARRREPLPRAAIVAFLGWVLLYAAVFSFARGIYHSYYTSALAPGIAALAGIGGVTIADLVRRDRRWLVALLVVVGATVAMQLQLSGRVPGYWGWLRPYAVIAAAAGVLVLALVAWRRGHPLVARLGMAVIVGGLLLIPGAWSVSEAANVSLNTTLPQAGPRQGAAGRTFGSQSFDSGTSELAAWLRTHVDAGARWDLVVTSAQNASTLIARDGLAVMAMGGFSGRDNAMTLPRFADLVEAGDVRFVQTQGGFGGGPGGGFRAPGFNIPGTGVPGTPGARADGAGSRFTRPGTPSLTPPPPRAPATAPGGAVPPSGAQPSAPVRTQGAGGLGGSNAVMSAAGSACTPVTDTALPANIRGSLYDCAGKAEALRALIR